VLVGELNRPVLLLNLPASADTVGGELAGIAAAVGEPLHLSLRLLLRDPPRWRVEGRAVFVCENPSVVALAAGRLGAACAPLVCTDGNPAAAQLALLGQLQASGARLRYHGDFDWPGIRIANVLMREFDATPWRYGVADYQPLDGAALAGEAVPASWDTELIAAMSARGIAVHEEAMIEVLLADLASYGPAAHSSPFGASERPPA
jgi:uncharacterized protein (TIGR02679 family)